MVETVSQAKLGRTEAEKVARAALAAATAVMQAKRVEILVPPQAAAWLQVCLLSCRCTCLPPLLLSKSQQLTCSILLYTATIW